MATTKVLTDAALRASLALPRTSFPMRANAAVRERTHMHRITTELYRRHLKQTERLHAFVLHDGPPYANGSLHVGHVLNKVLKDTINRRRMMMPGGRVVTVPGWDCHGLPIELKALSDAAAAAKKTTGAATAPRSPTEIRAAARRCAEEAIAGQRDDLRRWGVLGDWDIEQRATTGCAYVTMDPAYEAAQLRVFRSIVARGLVYRALKPVYWSPSTSTALAEAELEYAPAHKSTAVYVGFPAAQAQPDGVCAHVRDTFQRLNASGRHVHAVVWTTTPWTLPGNVAIAVSPTMRYSVVELPAHTHVYVIADERRAAFAAAMSVGADQLRELASFLGSELQGVLFTHPLGHVLPGVPSLTSEAGARLSRVLLGKHVTADAGTGLVHTAPGHGHDDFDAVRDFNATVADAARRLPVLCDVDAQGRFVSGGVGAELVGKHVLTEGNDGIVALLKQHGGLLHQEVFEHRYPYDWRSKKPIIIRATEQWFVNVENLLAPAKASLSSVRTVPPTAATRLDATLGSRTSWCISRQRVWGVPIPAFFNMRTGKVLLSPEVIEHVAQLVERHGSDIWWTAERVQDLLPPSLAKSVDANDWQRGSDTLDVWFDSGSAWAGTWAGAAKQLRGTSAFEPADVVLEGSDQHRGWFQSSLLTCVAAHERAPYRALLTHGFVLDDKGRKMSKSLGNVVVPSHIIEGAGSGGKKAGSLTSGVGADVLRLWAASSDYTADVTIGSKILESTSENLRKWRNTLRYVLSNLPGLHSEASTSSPMGVRAQMLQVWEAPPRDASQLGHVSYLDKLMLHRIRHVSSIVDEAYADYNFMRVVSTLNSFVTADLSAQYFDFCKDRLYSEPVKASQRRACQLVLWEALRALLRAAAPIVPYTAEDVFQHACHALQCASLEAVNDAAADVQVPDLTVFDVKIPAPASSWASQQREQDWQALLWVRAQVNRQLEAARDAKQIGSSSEAAVHLACSPASKLATLLRHLHGQGSLETAFLCSGVHLHAEPPSASPDARFRFAADATHGDGDGAKLHVAVVPADGAKCARCWKFRPEVTVHPNRVCARCEAAVAAAPATK